MEVYSKNQIEKLHRWTSAPDEVYFLREPHRHLFNIKTTIEVDFADRDVEFIMASHRINEIMDRWKDMDTMDWSCETMAIDILKNLSKIYPNREMSCDVNEDGENGAVVHMNKEGEIY